VAARANHPGHLGQRRALIGDVLEHVEHRGNVDAFVWKRQMLSRRLGHDVKPSLEAVTDGFVIHVDAVRAAVARQARHHGSGSAAHIQQPQGRRPVARLRQVVVQNPEDDLPPAEEPPMAILDLPVLAIELALQVSLVPA